MPDRITRALAMLRHRRQKGLIPFITGGFPTLSVTTDAIVAIAEAGATAIEVGIPFSDPIADGPVIAQSMHHALVAGVDTAAVLDAVRAARKRTEVPMAAMVSSSIVWRVGPDNFLASIAAAGFDGLVVPDIDLAQAPSLAALCDARSLALGLLVAQTTPAARIAEITRSCRGFVYLLARAGLTGERDGLPEIPEIAEAVARVRQCTQLPVAAGFGLASAAQVAAVAAHADAAIVGSAYVRRMALARPVEEAAEFTRLLVGVLAELNTGA
ncbi:MAG: tryptophan synthase subunit alpha [Phycisphaerales bacterium]|nr:tryptophan synthase subunit alpha [Phycisphaerales bacterium]